jgi:hypothetical protein
MLMSSTPMVRLLVMCPTIDSPNQVPARFPYRCPLAPGKVLQMTFGKRARDLVLRIDGAVLLTRQMPGKTSSLNSANFCSCSSEYCCHDSGSQISIRFMAPITITSLRSEA